MHKQEESRQMKLQAVFLHVSFLFLLKMGSKWRPAAILLQQMLFHPGHFPSFIFHFWHSLRFVYKSLRDQPFFFLSFFFFYSFISFSLPPLLSFRYSSFLFGYCLKLIHKILRVDFFGLLSVSFLLLHFDFIFLFLHPFLFFFSHQTGQLKSIRLDGLIQSSQCQWDSTGTLHTGCITELQELDANCMLIWKQSARFGNCERTRGCTTRAT